MADSIEILNPRACTRTSGPTPSNEVEDPTVLEAIRTALLDEEWGTAVAEWIGITGIPVDVWTEHDTPIWSQDMIDEGTPSDL